MPNKIRILMGSEAQVTTFADAVMKAISLATGGTSDVISQLVKERLAEKAGSYPEAGDRLLTTGEKKLYDLYHAFGGSEKDWNEWYSAYRANSGFGRARMRAFLKQGTLELEHLDIKP